MRAALAALTKGCLGALSLWCAALGLLLATAAIAACSFAAGWCYGEHRRSRAALESVVAGLAARGEFVGVAPAPADPGSTNPDLAANAEKLRGLARSCAIGRKWPKCRELLGGRLARVGWRSDAAPSHNGGLAWVDVACQLEMAFEVLEDVHAILDAGRCGPATAVDEAIDRAIVPWLAWSAMESLHDLDSAGAIREIARIRRLADRHSHIPSLDAQLWRCALLKSAIRLSWEVLQTPALDGKTLEALATLWAEDQPLAGISETLRRERSIGIGAFAALVRSMETDAGWRTRLCELGSAMAERRDAVGWIGEATAWMRYGLWRVLWADEELACFLSSLQIVIDHIDGNASKLSWSGIRGAWATAESSLAGRSNRMGLDRLIIGSVGLNGGRAACQVILEYEAERRMLLIDIARCRYDLDHGDTPADLGQLVPAYLPRIPLDPMDGMPLRYRLDPCGGPILYSVGPDCRDDNGSPEKPDSQPAAALSHGRDMVWPIADFPRSVE
ncbi:MAG TPA: hypothetical protein PLU30_18790 [Verrucomicrobiae bacterium]|nr:hypothetical protein [Verrucomicrobiae bacterium]